MIETTLYDTLAADTGVSALVGARIYPMLRPPADPLPAVVYQRIATDPAKDLGGDTGIDAVRIQVACWSATYAGAKALGAAVRAAVTGAAAMKATTEMDLDDRDNDTGDYRVLLDFRIWQR